MTKREFVTNLYNELEEEHDVQKIVNSIKSATCNNKRLSLDEQLEIVYLIRQIHSETTKGLFEDVSAFLTLVNQVEAQIKIQSNSQSEGEGSNASK